MHKTLKVSRDLSLTGTQVITGVGFEPKSIVAIAVVEGIANKVCLTLSAKPSLVSLGITDAYPVVARAYYTPNNAIVNILDSAANQTLGTIQSWDADGITINWTQTGSGATGTCQVQMLFQSHY